VCLLAGCTLNALSAWDPERFLDETLEHDCDVSHMVYYRDVLALGAERARPRLATMRVTHDLGTRDYLARIHDELGHCGGFQHLRDDRDLRQFRDVVPGRRAGQSGCRRMGVRSRAIACASPIRTRARNCPSAQRARSR
jgi:hypothetical protein